MKCRSYGVSDVVVSSILKVNSFDIKQVIYKANNTLKCVCKLNDFFGMCNDLINENYLWKDGLHLKYEE